MRKLELKFLKNLIEKLIEITDEELLNLFKFLFEIFIQ